MEQSQPSGERPWDPQQLHKPDPPSQGLSSFAAVDQNRGWQQEPTTSGGQPIGMGYDDPAYQGAGYGHDSYRRQPTFQQSGYARPAELTPYWGYGPYGWPYALQPPIDTSAIMGLVLAIVSWFACPIALAIPALILASKSKAKIAASGGTVRGGKLNTVTFWIAWLNIGIVGGGLLVSVMYQVFLRILILVIWTIVKTVLFGDGL